MVRVLALPSGGSRFEPRSRQLVKAIGGINRRLKVIWTEQIHIKKEIRCGRNISLIVSIESSHFREGQTTNLSK